MSDYMVSVLSLICIESFVALSTYLLLITGQISFGQQAYFGIGAYIGAVWTAMLGFDLSTAILAGAIIAGLVAAGVGLMAFRLGGLYYAIATLAFSDLVRQIWINLIYQVPVNGFEVGPKGAEGFKDIRYVIENDISATQYLGLIALCLGVVLIFFIILSRIKLLPLRSLERLQVLGVSFLPTL